MGKIKAGIIVFLGTNCEQDTKRACEFFGWKTKFIRYDEQISEPYDVIFIPGGFSYGDHVSSGRLAKMTPAILSLPFKKSLIVGICNGFQILCEAKLLPGVLTYNKNLKFISKNCDVEFENQIIKLPIAHKQGNYISTGDEHIIMKYIQNENGSDKSAAGIYDRRSRIIGMMPHPERAMYAETGNTDGRKVFEFIQHEI